MDIFHKTSSILLSGSLLVKFYELGTLRGALFLFFLSLKLIVFLKL